MNVPLRPSLRVVHVMGWRSQQYGSVERFLVALSRQLREVGGALTLVLPEPPASTDFTRELAAQVVCAPLATTAGGVVAVRRMRRLLEQLGPTHLHVHHGVELYTAPLAGRLAGVPARFATKHNLPSSSRASALRHRWLATQVTTVLAVSHETGERLLSLGLPPDKVAVTYLGVDPAVYAPDAAARRSVREELGLGDHHRLVLSTSHFRLGKGGRHLPRVAAGLVEDVPDAVVVAAGDGPERTVAEREARALGLGPERFRLLGLRQDVPRLLAAADVFVFPTVSTGAPGDGRAVNAEGLPLAVLEAAASGTAVVSSAVSDLPQLLDGTVRFVQPGDVEGLRRNTAELLLSPGECERLATAARARVHDRCNVRTAAQEYVDRYLATVTP